MICRPHLEKWSEPIIVLRYFCEIELLLQSLSTSSSKSGPNPSVFDNFYVINYLMTMWSTDEMELSLQSPPHFVDLMVELIFKKWSEAVTFYDFSVINCLMMMNALAGVARVLCQPHGRTHLQKVVRSSSSKSGPKLSVFHDFYVKSISRHAHFVDRFPDRGAHPRIQTPSSGGPTDGNFTRIEKAGFRARECFQL